MWLRFLLLGFVLPQVVHSTCASKCPSNSKKVEICRYYPTDGSYETRCTLPEKWNNTTLWHANDYCGKCKPEHVKEKEICTSAAYPCNQFPGKMLVCQYSLFHNSFKTKCIWPETYNLTGISNNKWDYCGACKPEDENRCDEEHVIYYDKFNYRSTKQLQQSGWVNGHLAYDDFFGKILGRFDYDDPVPERLFDGIPTSAAYMFVEFDFLEIDDWDGETFSFALDDEVISLGGFKRETNEGKRSGITPSGVYWKSYSAKPPHQTGFNFRFVDQVHHVTARVPPSFYADGELKLRFFSGTQEKKSDESAGIDNVKLTAFSFCGGCLYKDKILISETFEPYSTASEIKGWSNAKLDSAPGFSKFLGRYDAANNVPEKDPRITYQVPKYAKYLTLEFDFYEIDGWEGVDSFDVYVDDEKLELRIFGSLVDEGYKGGITPKGIVWVLDSSPNPPSNIGFGTTVDQKHHLRARIPSNFFVDGLLSLRFATRLNGQVYDESAGFDNIQISGHYDCGQCLPSEVIDLDSFEDQVPDNALAGWVNGKLEDANTTLTKFLGRYDVANKDPISDPVKVWFVPPESSFVTVEFDFYEIDEWEGKDCIYVYINNVLIDVNIFSVDVDEGARHGTKNGITWESKSTGPPTQIAFADFPDQIHHFTAFVPSQIYTAGLLQLRLSTRVNGTKDNESAGYDNIRIVAHRDCGPCIPEKTLIYESFEDRWTDGWKNAKLDYGPNFTYFLGRYDFANSNATLDLDPVKTFSVPPTATSLTLSFDFYEIDTWIFPDCAYAYVNGKDGFMGMNFFNASDDGMKGNITKNGIVWTSKPRGPPVNLGFNTSVDQIHHVVAVIPPSVYENGEIELRLSTRVNGFSSVVSSGWDNIKITASFDCAYPSAAPTSAPSITGRPSTTAAPSAKVTLAPNPTRRPNLPPGATPAFDPDMAPQVAPNMVPNFTPAMTPAMDFTRRPNQGPKFPSVLPKTSPPTPSPTGLPTDATQNPKPAQTGSPSSSPKPSNEAVLGSVCGKVEEDVDDNDTGDLPLVGVLITLSDPTTSSVIATTATDSTGGYCFVDLPVGMYTITETNPPGFVDVSDVDGPNDGTIATAVLPQLLNVTERNFVDEKEPVPSASPSGVPSSGPSLVASGSPSDVPSTGPSSAPSGAPSSGAPSGSPSSRPSVLPGNPTKEPSVSVVPSSSPSGEPSGGPSAAPSSGPSGTPSGLPSSVPSGSPSGVPSAAPSSSPSRQPSLELDPAPPRFLGSISGKVEEDIDDDDTPDLPIPGVVITLKDITGTIIAMTMTDTMGAYLFPDLPVGVYIVEETNKPIFTDVSDVDGANDNTITTSVIPSALNSTGNDFVDERAKTAEPSVPSTQGPLSPSSSPSLSAIPSAIPTEEVPVLGSICGKVEEDTDNDDIGNVPIPGVLVTLLDPLTSAMIATTVTDTTGEYCFVDLPVGVYQVIETNPPGFSDVSDVDGPNDNSVITSVLPSSLNITEINFVDERLSPATPTSSPDGSAPGSSSAPSGTPLSEALSGSPSSKPSVLPGTPTKEPSLSVAPPSSGPSAAPSSGPSGKPSSLSSSAPSGSPSGVPLAVLSFGPSVVPSGSPSEAGPIFGSICGKVEEDVDDNDTGDLPLVGVLITLSDPITSSVIATTATDSTGGYCFVDLPVGMYTITETNPPGFVDVSDVDGPNDGTIATAVLPQLLNVTERNFVDEKEPVPSASPSGVPSSGPSLVASGSPSDVPSTGPSSAPSGAPSSGAPSGSPSSRPSVLPGNPTKEPSVSVVPSSSPSGEPSGGPSAAPSSGPSGTPSGLPSSVPSGSPSGVPSAAPSSSPSRQPSLELDPAPPRFLGSISGKVEEDIDDDDTPDLPIPGVVITLKDITGTIIAMTMTDTMGAYLFPDLPVGVYIVEETNKPIFTDVSDVDGANDNTITTSVIPSALNSTGNDFVDERAKTAEPSVPSTQGPLSPSSSPSLSAIPSAIPTEEVPVLGSICGKVEEDTDNDDIGNVPIPGVLVTLLDPLTSAMIATTVTDTTGEYCFVDLPVGVYQVIETNPPGFSDVSDVDGPNDNSVITSVLPSSLNITEINFVDERLSPATPTSSPSPSEVAPSSAPVEPKTCNCRDADDRTFFVGFDFPKVNCTWLASRPDMQAQVCNKKETAFFYCPVTCGKACR